MLRFSYRRVLALAGAAVALAGCGSQTTTTFNPNTVPAATTPPVPKTPSTSSTSTTPTTPSTTTSTPLGPSSSGQGQG